jgi:hypothetical protein
VVLDHGDRVYVGQPTHLHREIEKAEAILDPPSSSSRAAQHKAAVAMAYNLLNWHGHRATTTRGGKWALLAGILTGDRKVDLFDHLCAFKRRPGPTVEKLRGRAQSSTGLDAEGRQVIPEPVRKPS